MEIIGALGAAIIVAMTIFLTSRKKHTATLEGIADIYEAMGNVLSDTNADRFLILYTSNGGGRPNVGSQLYWSVLYELHTERIKSIKAEGKKIPADQEYVDIMLKLDREEKLMLYTRKMEYSLLQDIYEREGITCAYVFKIKAGKQRYYYASIQTVHKDATLDLATIRLAAARIKNIFKNAK